jgi:hypothetical protein
MCNVDGTCYYADVPLGLYVVRGDSMVLLGQVGNEDQNSKKVTLEELEERTKTCDSRELEWDFDTDLVA